MQYKVVYHLTLLIFNLISSNKRRLFKPKLQRYTSYIFTNRLHYNVRLSFLKNARTMSSMVLDTELAMPQMVLLRSFARHLPEGPDFKETFHENVAINLLNQLWTISFFKVVFTFSVSISGTVFHSSCAVLWNPLCCIMESAVLYYGIRCAVFCYSIQLDENWNYETNNTARWIT